MPVCHSNLLHLIGVAYGPAQLKY